MALPIIPIQTPAISAPAITPPVAAPPSGGVSFQSVFDQAVHTVENFSKQSEASVNRFLAGEGEDLHQVALKAQQADLSFELFLEVRNKVIAAYQDVMRMQV